METTDDIGTTLLATIRQINNDACLQKVGDLEKVLEEVASACNLDIKAKAKHQFEPLGASVAYILGSSHLLVHTWPEHKKMTVDVHMCSKESLCDGLVVCESIKTAVGGHIASQSITHH